MKHIMPFIAPWLLVLLTALALYLTNVVATLSFNPLDWPPSCRAASIIVISVVAFFMTLIIFIKQDWM